MQAGFTTCPRVCCDLFGVESDKLYHVDAADTDMAEVVISGRVMCSLLRA